MNGLGNRIRELRLANKMSQTEFAERINVAKSSASAHESGVRYPSHDILIKIAELFHVTTDNLLGRSNHYTIDVSELTPRQRSAVQEIVTTYQAYNRLYGRYCGGDGLDDIYDGGALPPKDDIKK